MICHGACLVRGSNCLPFANTPDCFVGFVLLILFFVLFWVFTFLLLCCDVHYDFRIKTMFGSSLPPVVCKEGSCLINVICVCLCTVVSNTYCVVFLKCFFFVFSFCLLFFFCCCCFFVPYVASFSVFSVFIAPSVFSNVYLIMFALYFRFYLIIYGFNSMVENR
jgi:hypothetical protein